MDKPVTDYFGFPNQSGIYDNFRPKYPQQIVDEIIAVCGRKAAERVENGKSSEAGMLADSLIYFLLVIMFT